MSCIFFYHFRRFIWIPSTIFLVLSLASCSILGRNTQPAAINTQSNASNIDLPQKTWEERQASLKDVERWQVTGKIAIQTPKQSISAVVKWRESKGHYFIVMNGPMGANNVRLSGGPNGVTLTTGDGKQFHAANAEQLLAEKAGISLPVSFIRYWILGMPVPNMKYGKTFDKRDRLASLRQGGFFIQYLKYNNFEGRELPQLVAINSPKLRAKIFIYNWKL